MPSLAELVPEIAIFNQQRQQREQSQLGQLQQMGALQGILQKHQAMQQEQEMRGVLSKVAQQTGGDPAKMVPALLQIGTPVSIKLAEGMKGLLPKPAEPFSLTPGSQRYGADNQLIAEAPARELRPQNPSNVARLMEEKAGLPPGDPRHAIYDNAIRKESEIARQIAPSIHMPRNPQWLDIEDPLKPGSMIKVNPEVYNETAYRAGNKAGVVGASKSLTDAGKLNNKREFNMQGIGSTIQKAEELLTGATGRDLPTGSGAGNIYDTAAGFVGISPSGAKEAEDLRALGGALVSKMPRMEGPQSDKDVMLYKEMAGRVGDASIPRERRVSALNQVKDLWAKYERLNPDAFAGAQPGAVPNGMPNLSEVEAEIARRRARGRK